MAVRYSVDFARNILRTVCSFEVHTEGAFEDSHVFRDREEALDWLVTRAPGD